MPLLDLFWTFLMIFLFVVWIWILISVFIDLFRTDMSGWFKALWVLFIIFLPLLGVLAYLIVHGSDMQQRAMDHAVSQKKAQDDYIREMSGGGGSAEELEKLAQLRNQGVLTDEEFAAQKAKILA